MIKEPSRQEIFVALNDERIYQNTGANSGIGWDDMDKKLTDFTGIMLGYMNDARAEANTGENERALESIFKLTAIGVAVLESFGLPELNRPGLEVEDSDS